MSQPARATTTRTDRLSAAVILAAALVAIGFGLASMFAGWDDAADLMREAPRAEGGVR